jgi:hypothetical protein
MMTLITDHPVVEQHLRATEARFGTKILDNHRLVREQGVSRLGVGFRA